MAEADPIKTNFAVPPEPAQPKRSLRKRLLTAIAGGILLAGTSYGGWFLLVGSHEVETDNAYVGADTASVTPMVSGQVLDVLRSDTDVVKRGDILMRLDDRDARIALDQAAAALSKARRQFGQASASSNALAAQVRARSSAIAGARAQLATARAALAKAQVDFDRRQKLAGNGAVSGDELTGATNALAAARAGLAQAEMNVAQAQATRSAAIGELAANDALITGTTTASNPDVLAASARLRQAQLDLERTVIRAPIDGVVTSRSVQVGQRLAAGSTIMRIVPDARIYVDANFKEGQLKRVHPGQRVTLTSDLYGGGVVYHGRVKGFSGGTGASFALIPAQNATGNWIKVVQRLPVRLVLDPREVAAHPLRVGLSMTAIVDTTS